MTGDYRAAFYAAYARTHTVPRKGELTMARLERLQRAWRAHFAPHLPSERSTRILDAGCGDGALLWWLQRQGYDAMGVEVSEEQAAIARALGVQSVVVAPLQDFLASHPGDYDVVVLRNVLEHFPKAELLQVLDLTHGALRPGGRLIAQVPNGQSPFAGRIRYGDFTHELAFTESSLGQILAVHGFPRVRCYPVPPVFWGPAAPLRAIWWQIVQLLYRSLLAAEIAGWPWAVTLDILVTADRST